VRYHSGPMVRLCVLGFALLLSACPGALGGLSQCEPTLEPPTQLLFAPLGQTLSTHVTFKNPTTVPMLVQRLALEPDDVFVFPDERRDLLVPPGTCAKPGTIRLQLDFTATRLASRTATLSGAFGDDFSIVLRASGTGPRLEVPETVSFVPMSLFDEPATRPLSLRNIGTVDSVVKVALSAPRAGNETTTADELCVGRLQAGECTRKSSLEVTREATVSLSLSPKTPGEKSWELLVSSDEPRAPPRRVRVVSQVLDTTGCLLRARPDRLTFGLLPVERRVIAVENMGTSPCLISRPRIEGNRRFWVSAPTTAARLEPRGMALFEVTATFASAADLSGADLVLDAPRPAQQTFRVPLAIVLGDPSCLTLPDRLDLGPAELGCVSRSATVSLYNSCRVPLVVRGVSTTGPFVTRAQFFVPDGGVVLQPGEAPQRIEVVSVGQADSGVEAGTLIIGLAGAQRVIPLAGLAQPRAETIERFELPQRPRADLVFVFEEGPSFVRHLSDVRQQLQVARETFNPTSFSARVAVTTTDVSNTGPRGRFRRTDGGAAWAASDDQNFAASFEALTTLSDAGATQTSCLEAAARSVSAPLSTDPQGNAGFRRDGVQLALICVTDDVERSASPETWRDTLRSLDAGVSYSVFGPFQPGCSSRGVDDGGHQLSTEAFRGVTTSLCSGWGSDFGSSSFGVRDTFFLSGLPDRGSAPITVQVDGVMLAPTEADGGLVWEYLDDQNAIRLPRLVALPRDSRELVVRYRQACR
jgi:hypothetical protein